jgi:hypothetical protein
MAGKLEFSPWRKGASRTCLTRLRMITASRSDDSIKRFEPRETLYFANECSDAVPVRTLL